MSVVEEMRQQALRIRKKLINPPNAIPDTGIDLTRKSTAYRGDTPPPDTPPKKKLIPETIHPQLRLPIKFDDIFQEVSAYYGINREVIMSGDRKKRPVLARRVIVFLALKMLQKGTRSVSSIARDLDQDHTTVLHSRNKINALVTENAHLMGEISLIEDKILASYRLKFALSNEREPGLENGSGKDLPIPGVHSLDQGILGPMDAAEGLPTSKIDQRSLHPQDHPEPT